MQQIQSNGQCYKSNETQWGVVWFCLGLIVLLYALNLFQQSLNTLVMLAGCGMIAYGFIKVGGLQGIQLLIERFKNRSKQAIDS